MYTTKKTLRGESQASLAERIKDVVIPAVFSRARLELQRMMGRGKMTNLNHGNSEQDIPNQVGF